MRDGVESPRVFVDELWHAFSEREPLPLYSAENPGAPEAGAYDVQQAFVDRALRTDRVIGFKAGLTTPASQARFGSEGPVFGVLMASGRLAERVSLGGFSRPMVELEVGFRFKEAVTTRVASAGELRERVAGILPVIELPDLGFVDMSALTAADIIAANVSARGVIMGQDVAGIDPDGLEASLHCNGEELTSGSSRSVMTSQWVALAWLVNRALAAGYRIEPGQVLITGAIGQMVPASLGSCIGRFGPLGEVVFQVVP